MRTIILAALLLTCAQGYSQNTPAEKVVLKLSEKKNMWFTSNKVDSINSLLDTRCVYVHSNGWTQTAKEVVADAKTGKVRYASIDITESKARQFEKIVIVNSKGVFAGSNEGKDFKLVLAVTEVYINRAAGWKLISRHASRFPEP